MAKSYGDRAWAVAAFSEPTGKRWPLFGQRISPSYPYIEAEVRYAVRREYACTVVVSIFVYNIINIIYFFFFHYLLCYTIIIIRM